MEDDEKLNFAPKQPSGRSYMKLNDNIHGVVPPLYIGDREFDFSPRFLYQTQFELRL